MDNGMSLESITGNQAKMKYYSTVINTNAEEDKGYMDFDSYLKVLAAQMSNQDFNDPMSDAEFMQQMASYSMMEAIGQMNQQAQISYATSLVGKAVTVSDGNNTSTGIVDSVVISDGKYSLLVNGEKYSADQVTDVVDTDSYNKFRELIGSQVSVKDGENIIPGGKISDIYFRDGVSYAVIGKQAYDFASLIFDPVSDDEDSSGYSSANVETSAASMFMPDDGTEVFDGDKNYGNGIIYDPLENEITDDTGTRDPLTETDTYTFDPASLAFYAELAEAQSEIPDTAASKAAVLTEDGYFEARVAAVNSGIVNTDEEEGILRAPELTDEDFVSASVMNIAENKSFADGNYYTPTYGANKYYDNNAAYNPNRAFAAEYPEEAALADQLGTKMYDIRYIHNTSINSEIKRDIVGYSSEGKAFTDIGFSGKGRLGEVVTWADGTQRVELISPTGSTWFTTSGRFTLDQICDENMTYYGIGRELTPFEGILRAASKVYTPEEQRILDQYNEIYLRNAKVYNVSY